MEREPTQNLNIYAKTIMETIRDKNLDVRVHSAKRRVPQGKCGIDIDALPCGAFVLNDRADGVVEVPLQDDRLRKPGQTLETCLEIRRQYAAGDISLRGLRDAFKINTKQVQQILRGEWYTPEIRKAERLDETGGRLSLMGTFEGVKRARR